MDLILQFFGGRLDGREYVANSANDESDATVLLFRLSDYGTVGKEFSFIPPEDIETIAELGWGGAINAGYPAWPVSYIVTACIRRPDCITVHTKDVDIKSGN
jgi:hypothetical protein